VAHRALKQQSDLEPDTTAHAERDEKPDAMKEKGASAKQPDNRSASSNQTPGRSSRWRGVVVPGIIAVALLAAGGTAQAFKDTIHTSLLNLFGPPAVAMSEAYQPKPEGPTFDHSLWHKIVSKHVDEAGFIDYPAIKKNPVRLNQYIDKLAEAPFDKLGRDEKLALLINAYNAFTVKLILDNWNGGELASIKDIPKSERWEAERWRVGSHTWSLNQIEHEQIRPKFKEPRIHFAVVCAAFSCPPLRTEAYCADRIKEQLADQAKYVHNHDRWYRYEPGKRTVHLTALYDWYGGDLEQAAGSVLQYVARYAPKVKQDLASNNKPTIEWIDYSWKLNSQANRSMLNE